MQCTTLAKLLHYRTISDVITILLTEMQLDGMATTSYVLAVSHIVNKLCGNAQDPPCIQVGISNTDLLMLSVTGFPHMSQVCRLPPTAAHPSMISSQI